MNLSDLKSLQDGDKVVFSIPFQPFTVGKEYVVKKTGVGLMVFNDEGMGIFLCGIESHFEKQEQSASPDDFLGLSAENVRQIMDEFNGDARDLLFSSDEIRDMGEHSFCRLMEYMRKETARAFGVPIDVLGKNDSSIHGTGAVKQPKGVIEAKS